MSSMLSGSSTENETSVGGTSSAPNAPVSCGGAEVVSTRQRYVGTAPQPARLRSGTACSHVTAGWTRVAPRVTASV